MKLKKALDQIIDEQNFVTDYWQKKPLVFRNIFINPETLVSGDELAGLACEENVESRIIRGSNKKNNWQCAFGPFAENYDYDALGSVNWTLLVQSVDHFIPEVRKLLNHFNFIPQWRLDDVMFSYATTGGGVGPHFDYYDVFLIQTSGSREWKIGQICDDSTPLRDHEDMKLLTQFTESESHTLNPGDMIYIPAGVAHWGTAQSQNCITASIGFRAPAEQDLVYSAALELSNNFPQNKRYKDVEDDAKTHQDAYNLSHIATQQFEAIYQSLKQETFVSALRTAFAKEVTTARHPELFEYVDYDSKGVAANIQHIRKHPNARFAYIKNEDTVTLFVNGLDFNSDMETSLAVCNESFESDKNYDFETLTELCRLGFLLIA